MSNKLMAGALLLALNTAAWAQSAPVAASPVVAPAAGAPAGAALPAQKESPAKPLPMSSPTFGQIADLNAQWQYQEVLNKLNEARAKGTTAPKSAAAEASPPPIVGTLPKPVAAGLAVRLPGFAPLPVREDVHVSAVYGMGENLYADVRYGDLSTTVSVLGNSRLGPWTVVKLTPDELTLRQETVVGKGKKRKVTKTSRVIAISSVNSPASSAEGGHASSDFPELPRAKSSPTSMTAMPALPIPMPAPPSMKE
jgi:hypothetical protein